MIETMKCLVKSKPETGLWMEERSVPEIGDDDVLIRIAKTGICGTDIHIWNWDEWAQKTIPIGLIIGHEFVGEIAEVGCNAKNLKVGQRVSGESHLIGRQSRQSRAGRFHLDPETHGIGVNVDGAFCEYLKFPAFNVVPLPDAITDDIGAILDPLGNAVHTALLFDLVGEDVLITGAGPIGIMAAAVAQHIGARHTVITDVNQQRLDLAAKLSDVVTVNVTDTDLRDVIKTLDMKQGFDVGLEMSGNEQAFEQMVESMITGGRIAMLGIPKGVSTVDWTPIVFKSLTIQGVYGRQIFETWYKMIALLESGLDISPIITHRFPAGDFEEGFGEMIGGNSGKVVLDWNN